jgi:hypothetical protein
MLAFSAPLLESELLFDVLYEALADFLVVHRQYRLAAIQKDLQMGALELPECRSLFFQPSLELGALHGSNIGIIVYKYK